MLKMTMGDDGYLDRSCLGLRRWRFFFASSFLGGYGEGLAREPSRFWFRGEHLAPDTLVLAELRVPSAPVLDTVQKSAPTSPSSELL